MIKEITLELWQMYSDYQQQVGIWGNITPLQLEMLGSTQPPEEVYQEV